MILGEGQVWASDEDVNDVKAFFVLKAETAGQRRASGVPSGLRRVLVEAGCGFA
jgi:hypothetical protein